MGSRDDILNRLRTKLGRTAENAATAHRAMADHLARHPCGPRPALPAERVANFRARSEALSSTVEEVASLADVPLAAARYLRDNHLQLAGGLAPALAGLEWQQAGLSFEVRGGRDSDLVGITGCFCAVAETGTLMLCSSHDSPAALSLLPETHIAVVPASRIVAAMEDAWQLARDELGKLPRAVNFVSGPSRTGDIEQTIVLGAHGPYRVHLIIVLGD